MAVELISAMLIAVQMVCCALSVQLAFTSILMQIVIIVQHSLPIATKTPVLMSLRESIHAIHAQMVHSVPL